VEEVVLAEQVVVAPARRSAGRAATGAGTRVEAHAVDRRVEAATRAAALVMGILVEVARQVRATWAQVVEARAQVVEARAQAPAALVAAAWARVAVARAAEGRPHLAIVG
jgi:hypothetical protein